MKKISKLSRYSVFHTLCKDTGLFVEKRINNLLYYAYVENDLDENKLLAVFSCGTINRATKVHECLDGTLVLCERIDIFPDVEVMEEQYDEEVKNIRELVKQWKLAKIEKRKENMNKDFRQ